MARRTAAENAEALFGLYEQKMYRIAYAILHDEGQAEDAVIAAASCTRNRKGRCPAWPDTGTALVSPRPAPETRTP